MKKAMVLSMAYSKKNSHGPLHPWLLLSKQNRVQAAKVIKVKEFISEKHL
jgi:hypothetical protein